jgi:hypothetical protein
MSYEPDPEDLVCRDPSETTSSGPSAATTGTSSSISSRSASGAGGAPAYDPVTYTSGSAPGREQLVAKAMKKPPLPLGTLADNSAQRTTAQRSAEPYARAGLTTSGDSAYAEAALLKGRDPATGVEAEVFDLSAQVGLESELKLTGARVGFTTDGGQGSGSVEVGTLRAHVGVHNDDGSTGLNAGVSASLIGVEDSYQNGDGLSSSLSAGFSAGVQLGLRDQDGDEDPEVCARIKFGPGTLQGCVEF